MLFAAHKSHLIGFDRVEQFNNLSLPHYAILKEFLLSPCTLLFGPGEGVIERTHSKDPSTLTWDGNAGAMTCMSSIKSSRCSPRTPTHKLTRLLHCADDGFEPPKNKPGVNEEKN